MPLLLLLLIATVAGLGAAFLTRLYARRAVPPPVVEVALEAGRHAEGEASRRAVRAARLDPEKTTGLALTLALVVVLAGGWCSPCWRLSSAARTLAGLDSSVAEWGDRHTTAWSHDGVTLVTSLGATRTVVLVAAAVALVDRTDTQPLGRAVPAGGHPGRQALTETVKELYRPRPPGARAGGRDARAVVPSGHTSTAAAAWAAFALVASRWWGRPGRRLPALPSASRSRSRSAACCSTFTG